MRYHLDTIPLWEVMEQQAECPFCTLYHRVEQTEAENCLGGSLMEPAVRMRVNALGFCEKHHQLLSAQKDRLGHALLTDSHCKEILQKLPNRAYGASGKFRRPFLFWKPLSNSRAEPFIGQLEALSGSCIVCDNVNQHLQRYYHTFLHLWKCDPAFAALWDASRGPCIPHGAELLRHGQKHLSSPELEALADSVLSLLKAALALEEAELAYFTQQFDYRNQGRPWGKSKTALERTVRRLRGGFQDVEEKQTS
ncbi:MAG: DUF6062 family protein [Clostridia bacterium]|nr:DUF6062 family protein [Clostridia bacterium]